MPFVIFAVIAALIAGIAILSHRHAKKRRTAIRAWAESLGLRFARERHYGLDAQFADFPILQRGNDRYGYNLARGRVGDLAVWFFDYHYATQERDSEGKTRTSHHHLSVCIFQPPFRLRPLRIRSEHFFDRIREAFGGNDIDFESAEFSRRFHVSSPDKKWAYEVITPRTIEFLLESLEFDITFGQYQAALDRGRKLNADEYAHALRVAQTLFDNIPERVRVYSSPEAV